MSKDEEYKTMNIPMSGKLVTALDPTQLQEGDFQILSNMRYTDPSIKSVSGMTKINTSIMHTTYYRPRAGFQFRIFRPLAVPFGAYTGIDDTTTPEPPTTGDITFDLEIRWNHPVTLNLNSSTRGIGTFFMDLLRTQHIYRVEPILECQSGSVTYNFTFESAYTQTGLISAGNSANPWISSFMVAGVEDPTHGFSPVTGTFQLLLTATVPSVLYIPEVKIWGWP